MTLRDLGDYVEKRAEDGSRTGDGTFDVKPRSFLIVGSLKQLLGGKGGPIDERVQSFELFRRNIYKPEILRFDELLTRAEWHVQLAENQADAAVDPSQKPTNKIKKIPVLPTLALVFQSRQFL